MATQPGYLQNFTPELTDKFYESLARPIEDRTKRNVGKARGGALARGLEGDVFEANAVAGAEATGTNALADLWSGIGMQGAGMARDERLIGERNEYQSGEAEKGRQFQSSENERMRSFQAQMAELDRANARRMGRRSSGSPLGSIAGTLAGSFTGGLGAGYAKSLFDTNG